MYLMPLLVQLMILNSNSTLSWNLWCQFGEELCLK